MAWIAVDKDGTEVVYGDKPERDASVGVWDTPEPNQYWVILPKGSIKKLIGRSLTWEDECIEL